MPKDETPKGHTGSYYAATANAQPERPPLQGDVTADVCIVGAGFSGISTALHLAEKGKKVVVLEGVKIGFGASGRNGGQIINGYSRDYDTIKSRYGETTARALLNMSFEGGDIIRERVAKYDIKCDLKKGSFFAAFTDAQMKFLERRREVWAMGGHDETEILDKDRTRSEASDTGLTSAACWTSAAGTSTRSTSCWGRRPRWKASAARYTSIPASSVSKRAPGPSRIPNTAR